MSTSAPVRVLASPSSAGRDGNPYIGLLFDGVRGSGVLVREFDRRRLLSRAQIVHVHWPAALVRWESGPQAVADVVKVLAGLSLARLRGAKLVWTAHDLAPHELRRPRLHAVYFAAFSRLVDLWISLTDSGAEQLRDRHPVLARRPVRVIAHGSYRPAYGDRPQRGRAEQQLGLPSGGRTSFLLLGQLRRYKNALPLMRAFTAGAAEDERLLVAGEVRGDDSLEGDLREAAAGEDRITLRLGRVPDTDVAAWHGAADVVVLPYDDRSALNSGALLLALSLDTPVVVADSPVNRELRSAVGEQWVHLYRGGPAEALRAARAAGARPRAGRPDLQHFAWPGIVQDTVAAYRDLAEGRA